MKIKVSYGVDMRVFRPKGDVVSAIYSQLQAFVCTSFGFQSAKDFNVFANIYKEGEAQTVSSLDEFGTAYLLAQQRQLKSLKLRIESAQVCQSNKEEHEPEEKQAMQGNEQSQGEHGEQQKQEKEQLNGSDFADSVNAFFSNGLLMDLLSDLLLSAFTILQANDFQLSFLECSQIALVSHEDKYLPLTSSEQWPLFLNALSTRSACGSKGLKTFLRPMFKAHPESRRAFMGHFQRCKMERHKERLEKKYARQCKKLEKRQERQHAKWQKKSEKMFMKQLKHQQQGAKPQGCKRRCGDNARRKCDENFAYNDELAAVSALGFKCKNRVKKLLRKHQGDTQMVVQQLLRPKTSN